MNGTLEGPYRDNRLHDLGLGAPYNAHVKLNEATVIGRRPAKAMMSQLKRFLLGRPFRNRQFAEPAAEYWLAAFASFFEQRRAAIVVGFVALLATIVVYSAVAVSAGSAGIVLAPPAPPSLLSHETQAARRALKWPSTASSAAPLYAMPCTRLTNATRLLAASREVDVDTLYTSPRHDSVTDVVLAERLGRLILDSGADSMTSCTCGPLLGFPVRVLVTMGDDGKPLVFYNPRLLEAESADQRVMRHRESAWFDVVNASFVDNTSDVWLVRPAIITLTFDKVDEQTRKFTGAKAYCVTECLDLMDGRSIWHTALDQARAGIDVNAAHVAAMRRRFACLQ